MVIRCLAVAAIQWESACVTSTVISGSTMTASRLPEISVADVGDHIRLGKPGGTSSVTTGFEGATNTSHRSSAEQDVLKGSLILLSSSPRSRSFPDKDAGGGNSLPGRQWRGAERQVRSFELVIPHLRLVLPVREHAADHAMLDGSGSLVDRERTENSRLRRPWPSSFPRECRKTSPEAKEGLPRRMICALI